MLRFFKGSYSEAEMKALEDILSNGLLNTNVEPEVYDKAVTDVYNIIVYLSHLRASCRMEGAADAYVLNEGR